MAPTKNKLPKSGMKSEESIFTLEYLKKIVYDPHRLGPTCVLLFLFEIMLNIFIIERVNYTEIDWRAYMQEVEGFLNGTWDYKELKGLCLPSKIIN
jgi:alpha-1,3-mannosyltransferase